MVVPLAATESVCIFWAKYEDELTITVGSNLVVPYAQEDCPVP